MDNLKSNALNFISKEWLLLLLITVYFSNIGGSVWQYVMLLLIPVLIMKDSFWRYFDFNCIWVVVFSVSYALITSIYGFSSSGDLIIFSTFPLMFYITGKYLMDTWTPQKNLLFLVLIVPIAFTVFNSVFSDVLKGGYLNLNRRIEVNGSNLAVTLIGVRLSLAIAAFGMIFSVARTKGERFFKYLLIFLGILGVASTIHMLNRTGIVIALVSSLAVLLTNWSRYAVWKIVLILFFVSLAGFEMYPKIKESKALSTYIQRENDPGSGFNTAGGRTKRWVEGIEKIYTQPLGGGVYKKNGNKTYAHNFWLDVSELAGVLPFLALIACTFINLRKNLILIRSKLISPFLASWLVTLNLGFFLACFVEPIMEGIPSFAFLYFFFWGMTSILYDRVVVDN